MSVVSENGLLGEAEYKAYKHRSVQLKFYGQLFGAIAGATFFALLTQTAGAMLAAKGLAAFFAAINPVAAIGFIVVGSICTYMAQKYYFESNMLDGDFNTRKMGAAVRGQEPAVEAKTPTPGKDPVLLPTGMERTERADEKKQEPANDNLADEPEGVRWRALHADKAPQKNDVPSWEQKTQASKEAAMTVQKGA